MKSLLLFLLFALPTLTIAQPIYLDPSFGTNGGATSQQAGWSKVANDFVLQPDGKLLAAGVAYEKNGQFNYQTLVTRFLPNGKIDSSFGTQGSVHFAMPGKNEAQAIALQPDGKIVIACNESIILEEGDPPSAQLLSRPFIVRLNANGTFDNSFGNNGVHRLELLDGYISKELAAIAVLPGGKILAGGSVINSEIKMMLICLNDDGSYNNNFGTSGIGQYTIGSGKNVTLSDMAVQADGKIVLAGTAMNLGPTMPDAMLFALGRANADGTADASFGTQGMVLTQVSPGVAFIEDVAHKVVVQPDGKICLAGAAGSKLALARYLPNGAPDAAFGENGKIIHAQHPAATGLVWHNGKLYTCGSVTPAYFTIDMTISAFNADGSIDAAFAADGIRTFNTYKMNYTHALRVQQDGKLVTGGSFNDNNGQEGLLLSRFTTGNPTGIDPVKNKLADWVIYPNPADDFITLALRSTKTLSQGDICMLNASGQMVCAGKLRGQQITLPVKHLAAGVYALRISIGEDVQTLKFIKK